MLRKRPDPTDWRERFPFANWIYHQLFKTKRKRNERIVAVGHSGEAYLHGNVDPCQSSWSILPDYHRGLFDKVFRRFMPF